MRRWLFAVVLASLAGLPLQAESIWNTSGIFFSPAANTILCDTGALQAAPDGGGATIGVRIILASTANGFVQIEHRNADNSAVVTTPRAPGGEAQAFALVASQTLEVKDFTVILQTAGERVRVRLLNSVTGNMQCTIWSDQ